jgi:hypothetical protein
VLGKLLAAALLAATAVVALPAASATAASATAASATAVPSGLVTHTLSVSMTCSDGSDPAGTGPLDHVMSDLVVQVTAPTTVPFGGSITYTGFRYALTMAPNDFGPASSSLYAGPATHLVPEGHAGIGTGMALPSPGRFTSAGADFLPIDVRGPVGSVVSLPLQPLSVSWSVSIPPYGGYTIFETCTPDPGTPPLATTVIGPPPGGAPATDKLILAVRDKVTGAVVYQADTFISTGNFFLAPPGEGVHVIGTSTFPGVVGGTASFSLVSIRKTIHYGESWVGISTTFLGLSDPGAGIDLKAVSDWTVIGGPELNSENIYGVAGGTLAGSGHQAVISWEIRDLA